MRKVETDSTSPSWSGWCCWHRPERPLWSRTVFIPIFSSLVLSSLLFVWKLKDPPQDHFATLFMVNTHNQGNIFTSGSTNTHTLSRTAGQRVFNCNQLDKYYACATTDLPSCFDAGGLKQQESCLQQEFKSKMVLVSGRMLSVVSFKCRTYTYPRLRILCILKHVVKYIFMTCEYGLLQNRTL